MVIHMLIRRRTLYVEPLLLMIVVVESAFDLEWLNRLNERIVYERFAKIHKLLLLWIIN